MKNRFNPITNKLPIDYFIDFTITPEAENAFYYLANLMYSDFTDDEVKAIFKSPKALADEVSQMLNESLDDTLIEYRKSLQAVSCTLFKYFSTDHSE